MSLKNPRVLLVLAFLVPAALAAVCTTFPMPSSVDLPYLGGGGTFTTTPNLSCQLGPWMPVALDPWITIVSGGTSATTIEYAVAPNLTGQPRTGRISGLGLGVADFFVNQAAAPVLAIPTTSEWGLAALAGVLGLAGLFALGRRG